MKCDNTGKIYATQWNTFPNDQCVMSQNYRPAKEPGRTQRRYNDFNITEYKKFTDLASRILDKRILRTIKGQIIHFKMGKGSILLKGLSAFVEMRPHGPRGPARSQSGTVLH